MSTLRVASSTDSKKLADAIKHSLDAKESVELQAVGAPALNNIIKAVSIINFNAERKYCLEPSFKVFTIDNSERTGYSILLKQI